MALNIPNTLTAGDTLEFTDSLPDYLPVDSWVLTYTLINSAGKIAFSSTDNGDETHLLSVAMGTTDGWSVGEYKYQATVSDGTDRHTIETGTVEVLEDFSSETTYDSRTPAKKYLDTLIAARQSLAESSAGVVSVSHNNRSVSYDAAALQAAIEKARMEVAREDQAENIAKGLGAGNRILVRLK
ncbi:MAG: hypothetical protein GY927_16290 [bacterium]|nr:hypothetical protein [bacterium]